MPTETSVLRIAIATPLRRFFDYLPPAGYSTRDIALGIRVSVPFGQRKKVIGLTTGIAANSEVASEKLKKIDRLIDKAPLFEKKHLEFLLWASRYYHHPVGEVVFNAMPGLLKTDRNQDTLGSHYWTLTGSGRDFDPNEIKQSAKQSQLLNYFQQNAPTLNETELQLVFPRYKASLLALEKQQLVKKINSSGISTKTSISPDNITLNKEQSSAIKKIVTSFNSPSIHLLDGLTGSGKTEIYLATVEAAIKREKQCLVLLPEIGLTPQLIQRFRQRFQTEIAIQHSGLSDSERAQYWQSARSGKAKIILGTRSAVWVQLKNPGLYIIDEEHDLSYKQQDGFRYSARDMLIVRAKRDKIPVVLGSATPSLESLYNVEQGRYKHLKLTARAGEARLPVFKLLDIKGRKMHGPLSQTLIDEIKQHLKAKNQVLLFLNRRGYAVHLFCHQCGWKAECERCELPYTYHKSRNRLSCHHCESNRPNITKCVECDAPLILMGHGTERIEEVLQTLFQSARIARIDRDSIRKKQAMAKMLNRIHAGEIDILIGTQMLAKGHHFPNVTLAAIVDADRGLFSNDFRASERLAQLFMQVSGRTGRGEKTGTVIVQTHYPEHPLFHQLIQQGYNPFTKTLLAERQSAGFPPYAHMALLRAEAHKIIDAKDFISEASHRLKLFGNAHLSTFGPIPAIVEKRSGRYRFQLVIQSSERSVLHERMDEWLLFLESMRNSRKVRWSLDIDPHDMS